ncbi:hypothetical protein DNX69_10960 [Rhodopseudomonas palustris]|uniref:Uncharacterized protein n=1 Tax=Rhodopseudomonas palustris TaxID=1076 RepID=A0A323UI68_RHOPL|nr:hypothetical protein [Rhodopseudomonas palustris]PZA12485.1 hypothetical protein DNX69_10960 [Rhodopseudomonas palustris]
MSHQCPIAGCSAAVPAEVFMCARHWRMVPKPLQAAVYESFRSTGRLSDNHREAVRVVEAAEAGRTALDLLAGMKALTIWQPWASLVMIGAKPYEFRRWRFADRPHLAKLIGQRIVVHAGARPARPAELLDILERIDQGESALDRAIARPFLEELLAARLRKETGPAPLAAALGTAVLGEPRNCLDLFVDTVADSTRIDEHMYAWPLTDVQAFPEPIPAAGAQGFWNFT